VKNPLIVPELREYIATANVEGLRTLCEVGPPVIVAEFLSALEPHEVWEVLRHTHVALQAEIFSHIERETQIEVAGAIPLDNLGTIVDNMPSDDRVDFLKSLPEELHDALLKEISVSEREDIRQLSAYAEKTAGALMTSDHATLPADITAAEAIDLLRREAPKKETIYYAYVIDAQRRLVGFVSLKNLILAKPDARIGDIMKTSLVFAHVDDHQEQALRDMQKYDLIAMPVVDRSDRLAGIITIDDVMDVGEEEATTDFHRMATVGAVTGGMKEAGLLVLYRARIPWLLVLVFMNVFSGAGIAYFEDTIEAMVALVFFLPLLIDSGGNAGSQASTLMVRAMATGDVYMRDWFSLVVKEIAICLVLGITMAVAVSAIAAYRAPEVMVPVAITMVCTVMYGSLIGTSLPFLLTRLKLDPATASAPLVTSLADIGGVMIYFSVATWYLGTPA